MAQYDYDLFVIGAGSGGVRAARLAAMSGAKVAVAEEDRVGGTCVIRGCVPKKFMVYASEYAGHFKTAEAYGWSFGEAPRFDWPSFLAEKDKEIARLSGIYVTNLQNAGAELVHAKARLVDAHTVELVGKDKTVTAGRILIATGGRPWVPKDLPGIEHVITSDEAFHIAELPKRMVIAGGGYIAVEFACIFKGLGVDVTLVHRGPNILRGFDDHVRAHLAEEMTRKGINVLLGCQHERVEKTEDGLVSHLSSGAAIEADLVLFALGREPYVEGLGLEAAGVAVNDGAIVVDDYSRTNVESVWAVGDVTNRINLTPVAIREGAAFAQTEFYDNPTTFDHEMVASAVFSQPAIGSVGLTEAEARHVHGQVDVYLSRFRAMKHTFSGGEERALIKLVVDAKSQKLLGCHVVAPDGPEIIQMAAIALKMGVTKAQWDSTCAVHPTLAEELVTMREKYMPQDLGPVA
ncbi:MAG: glutathione-disulfide reductase [Phenylobacterium sp.]|uniref:glutathione-disulfide reductase n=1 Tax=Phenylobacterium sp. TaxID=1871053 RepID=UPI002734E486|nr:glutathione-disulfide reductase [Phenylobacterium sp.]MDP1640800.1 glutathione-disulfide reductase [Phenylobacterium sp.]MDP3117550.1 glutathione-disulfide reductase [Phenylobacterium sp.]MDP3383983.1 glutathione-disulfide reductase [Phenylobacterium sp.]